MKKWLLLLAGLLAALAVSADPVLVGATDTAAYYPHLAGRRVALLANHTSLVEGRHLVDLLHERGFNITGIFAPDPLALRRRDTAPFG